MLDPREGNKPISHIYILNLLTCLFASRFLGTDPEPRLGLSSGHMPNSFSLPFNTFLESKPEGFTVFRQPEDIKKQLIDAVGSKNAEDILSGKATVATTCGSGMTAAVSYLVLPGLRVLIHLTIGSVAGLAASWSQESRSIRRG